MKVLHLDSGREWRGGQQQLFLLATGLRRYDAVEQQMVLRQDSVLVQRLMEEGIPVTVLPFCCEADLVSAVRLRQLIGRFRPDVIHVHDSRTLGVLATATMLGHDSKVVAARRVAFPLKRNPLTRLKYNRLSDRIIAVSRFICEMLMAAGIDSGRVEVVYDGIEWPGDNRPITRAEARGQIRVAEDAFLIGCVGQFTAEKGHDVLISAFAKVAAAFPPAQLLLVGEGELRGQYLQQAEGLGVANKILLPGFVRDLERVWPALDLFVFPSRSEGLGSSLLMAMAHGVPVCASRTGGIPEVVTDGTTGYLFPSGDADTLSQCVLAIIRNPGQSRMLALNARERVRQRFTADRMIQETYKVYTNVLGC